MSLMSGKSSQESHKGNLRNLVIAISGSPGSGKSTCAKILAKKYGLRYISAGKLFRELAKKKGISTEDLHKLAEKNYEIDKYIDNRSLEEAKKGYAVIEGHLTAWILKDIADVKIYLKASLEERAKRISQRDKIPIDKALKEILFREKSNKERFKKIYNIDTDDLSIFDLIIDTTRISPYTVVKIISIYIDSLNIEK